MSCYSDCQVNVMRTSMVAFAVDGLMSSWLARGVLMILSMLAS
jgi:hypothetical protein